jgi:hypothetical protein
VSGAAGAARGPLAALARRAVTQPIPEPVASDDDRFLARKGVVKLAWRVLRRRAEVALSGQGARHAARIDPSWRRAVWFHAEAPQIGDALMDLAARSLLADRGIAVDLVAPPATAALFRGDRWLGRVGDSAEAVVADDYDFAIVDSDSWRALEGKRAHAAQLPWVSIHGEYLAYDFHRGSFTARRLAALLGIALDGVAERLHDHDARRRSVRCQRRPGLAAADRLRRRELACRRARRQRHRPGGRRRRGAWGARAQAGVAGRPALTTRGSAARKASASRTGARSDTSPSLCRACIVLPGRRK